MASQRSQNLIDYVIKHTGLSQADLARKLKVSRAQISKWKAGDSLSSERSTALLALAGLFETACIEWAMFAKTDKNARAWYALVLQILEAGEAGDVFRSLCENSPDLYVGHVITRLCELGARVEPRAPATIWIDEEKRQHTPLAAALHSVVQAWGQLKVWIDAILKFDDLSDTAEQELAEPITDLEWLTFDLALSHVEKGLLTEIGVDEGKLDFVVQQARQATRSTLHRICKIRMKHGLAITEDYFELLYLPPSDLAEQSLFRPHGMADHADGNLIKSYLPYGQRLILSHLEYQAMALRLLDEKLGRILARGDQECPAS